MLITIIIIGHSRFRDYHFDIVCHLIMYFFFFLILTFICGLDALIFDMIYIIGTIDFLAHKYHHTFGKLHHTNKLILSSKFVGIYYLMKFLEHLNSIDHKTHARLHHKEKSSTIEYMSDWLDHKIPFVWKILDYIVSIEWKVFIKLDQELASHVYIIILLFLTRLLSF